MTAAAANPRIQLRRSAVGMLLVLIVQFVIGMATNLFIAVPGTHPGSGDGPYFSGALQSVVWAFTSGLPLLVIHVILGILIFVNAIRVIVESSRHGGTAARWFAGLGAFGVVFAGINGASFLKYAGNFSSMLMASGFALAMISYTLILALE